MCPIVYQPGAHPEIFKGGEGGEFFKKQPVLNCS